MSPQAKAILLAVLAGVYLTPVNADETGKPIPPPARYDYPNPNMRVVERPVAEVHRICLAAGAKLEASGNRILGCAAVGKNISVVIIPTEHPHKAEILRHEQAHTNGWPGHHPR